MKLEFSKWLAIGVVGMYFLSLATTFVASIIMQKDTTNILNIVQPLVIFVLGGYLGKAGVENFLKIKGSQSCDSATDSTDEKADESAASGEETTEGIESEEVQNNGQ